MAGLVIPLREILTQLATIPVINNDAQSMVPTVRVWNNQVLYMRNPDGAKVESFPLPALFLEITSPITYENIGEGFHSADLGIRIHIVHEQLDDGAGGFEQDLVVFDLRDRVIGYLQGFKPTGCGSLDYLSEEQEFDHDNVYHYQTDFIANFTDSKGSRQDQDKPDHYIESGTPINVTITPSVTEGGGQQVRNPFIIPKK